MGDAVKYWLELSEYDMETAEAMLKTKRYLYVGFMCHQAAEKMLKAYYSKTHSETAPYTHSLTHLANITNLDQSIPEEIEDLLNELEPLNIEARYPSYKEKYWLIWAKASANSFYQEQKNSLNGSKRSYRAFEKI